MGDRQVFQPLTREDKITVVLYRIGIVLSAGIIAALAYFLGLSRPGSTLLGDVLGLCLYASVGMSVFFIHLYVGKFKVYLKNLYFISLGCLALLLFMGGGSVSAALIQRNYLLLLLLPLSGCLGFITAKEAFCFQLFEGYLLAMLMPLYLVLTAAGLVTGRTAYGGLILIAVLMAIFTIRKAPMPAAYDIGDKSAYQ